MGTTHTRFAQRTEKMESSIIREILKVIQSGKVISFAGGVPEPQYFPVKILQELGQQVLEKDPVGALQYNITEGFLPLREVLCEQLAKQGVTVSPDEVLITSGSQQGIDLLGRIFLDPGDSVLTEQPTFLGMIQTFTNYEANLLSQPIDNDGIILDGLEELINKQKPKLMYLLPNFQNPSGVTLSLERRKKLAELSLKTNTPILEDDPYSSLLYEGTPLPPIKSFSAGNDSILLGTFSKIIAPGHRIAWVAAPKHIIKLLVQAKQAADLHSNSFSQQLLYEFCVQGYLEPHIKRLQKGYRAKRDHMLAAMETYFPSAVSWQKPRGGLFIWVDLPEGLASSDVLQAALKKGVAFVPGKAFFTGDHPDSALRLSFATATEGQIEEGIGKLGKVLSSLL